MRESFFRQGEWYQPSWGLTIKTKVAVDSDFPRWSRNGVRLNGTR
ncbi:hypothetical protein SAMCFNEI73_pC0397 (plasmid) [Sinorhizobium americanum]|uniref:Uncharacterized protein n=1 Tax=Sinorhizobium americanum TaxID=194963 RepID=A0A1L3LVL7_9HYPH|nr:hypothetical protein SAMCFNEI73_pC0397 [Sinorhizobium americanum]